MDPRTRTTTEIPRPDETRAVTSAATPALAARLADRTPVEIRRREWTEFLRIRALPTTLAAMPPVHVGVRLGLTAVSSCRSLVRDPFVGSA